MLKYKVSFKPLIKKAIDMNTSAAKIVLDLGIAKEIGYIDFDMTNENIDKLCNYLGVPPNEIFTFVKKE